MFFIKYPVKAVVLPKGIKKADNGKLDKSLLKKTVHKGTLWDKAAFSFDLMYKEAKKAGYTLVNMGTYRSYEAQEKMFLERYSTKDLGRTPKVTRRWNKKTYFLKPGKSPSATPGTSNHGFGLACDLAVKDKKGNVVSLSSQRSAMKWMCDNAPKYGFYLQGAPKLPNGKPNPEWEGWHWQYCEGDKWPPKPYEAIILYLMALEANKPKP